MSVQKPSMYDLFKKHGDIRTIIDLVETHTYTDDDAGEVINFYEQYKTIIFPK
jgi:hypothetical protein